jgi:ketosteroid isomerase-like protein
VIARLGVIIAMVLLNAGADSSPADEREAVATLDAQFQAAVKANDASSMQRILHDDMVLVHGNGAIDTGAQLVEEARVGLITYEQQDEDPGTQTVRVSGDTAVVTARLWVKGVRRDGSTFDRRVWFSDTYVRTAQGWRYFFGQVSLPLQNK